MIVCSCNVITQLEIEEVIVGFLEEEPWRLITAGMVYHAMSKRGKCCSCFPGVIDTIVRVSTEFHRRLETQEAEIVPFVALIISEHERFEETRRRVAEARSTRAA